MLNKYIKEQLLYSSRVFFSPASAGGRSLETEWQQIS